MHERPILITARKVIGSNSTRRERVLWFHFMNARVSGTAYGMERGGNCQSAGKCWHKGLDRHYLGEGDCGAGRQQAALLCNHQAEIARSNPRPVPNRTVQPLFETKSAPTRERLESRIEDLLRHAGTRVTTRSNLDKGMKGVVQSLYKDAISALKAEGKIVELRNARRSPLFVHRDAIIDQLRVESGGDRERRPASPTHSFEAASISLDYIRPYYLALKAEQGGISTVKIYDILKKLDVSKDELHALLLREARHGRVSLHAASTVNFSREVMEAGIVLKGSSSPM